MPDATLDPVPLVVVGYDFRRASSRWRSRLVMKVDEHDALAEQLLRGDMASGLAVLSTCNRNEWIASTRNPEWTGQLLRARLLGRLKEASGLSRVPEPYIHVGREAARHLLHVAAGLESFVIGERQIAGQLSCAMQTARKRGTSSDILNGMGTACGRAARESARMPLRESSVRGVHDAGVRFLEGRFDPSDDSRKVLVVGAGDIGRRVVQSVQARTRWAVTLLNRTVSPLSRSAILPLTQLPDRLADADIMIVCTGALEPVIDRERLSALPEGRPLALLDLGIPNQVSPELRDIPGISLYDLDSLEQAGVTDVADPLRLTQLKQELEEILDEFVRFCRERDLVTVLKTTQSQHERYVQEIIPAFINTELGELSEEQRGRVAFKLNGLIREYTNSIFHSIHQTRSDNHHDS